MKSLAGGNNTTNQVDNEDSKGAACSTSGPSTQDFTDYEAFLATQMDTSQGAYELFKEGYKTPTRQFSHVKITGNVLKSGFQVTTAPCLGNKNIDKVILHKEDQRDMPASWQKTRKKVVRAIKPEINTCKISHIFTSINKGNYDVASNALSSQTIMNGIKQYAIQYDMMLLLKIPQVSVISPENIFKSCTVMLDAIDDYDKIDDSLYCKWQEFINHRGSEVELESDSWLEVTLHLSMELTLWSEVKSDLKCLPPNQQGAVTMLRFIIKRMVIRNQEAWDSLEDYIKVFDIRNNTGKNVPTTCLKLKAIVNVLGDKLPSNSVHTILEGFAKASTSSINQVCLTKIAMRSDSIYASLQDKLPLQNQVLAMLDDLKQKYQ
jgi:hypothetical protein